MRTTITIPEELLKKAMDLSGSRKYSEAIVLSLKDYVRLKTRLELLEDLFSKRTPHVYSTIKKHRRKRQWSSSTQASG